jgi:hypothetical protein
MFYNLCSRFVFKFYDVSVVFEFKSWKYWRKTEEIKVFFNERSLYFLAVSDPVFCSIINQKAVTYQG